MNFVYKKEFLKSFASYPKFLQEAILEADQQIKLYFNAQNAAHGLRIKKIGPNTFEARVTDKIRIVWVKKLDTVYFVLVGTHDDVNRFIKHI